jgi:methionyl-tRNA synthetase
MADELLEYYTPEQLRMHFMSLGLSSKSVGFKPQVYMPPEDRTGTDMVLKEGNLLTNVYNRLIRSCFYASQNDNDGKIPANCISQNILELSEKTVLEYERHMYNHDFHRVSYVLDDFVRSINKHWVNNVKIADSTGDIEFRKQLIADCFYACKVMAVLIHPIAPEGCEMFREYLNIGEKLWDWNYILDPISALVDNMDSHEVKYLEPRVDFFKKHECQLEEKGEVKSE